MSLLRSVTLGALCLTTAMLVIACDDASVDPDGGASFDAGPDGGASFDAGPDSDGGSPDGGSPDAGNSDSGSPDGGSSDAGGGALVLPAANASFDYQLGGPYPPPSGVQIVSRDRSASPAAGIYNICYVNGFQTQPDERAFWTGTHPELLLRDGDGDLVIDPDWDEVILDVRTPANRAALATIVGGWIEGCARDGFDAIEIDNLDTYARSGGLVSEDDAVAFMRLLSDVSHAVGLPMAQKNSAEVLSRRPEMGTDFAVVEECNRFSECGDFTAEYGDQVYVIEYRRADFNAGCRDFPELSMVLRDLDLTTPGAGAYVYEGC